MISSTDRNMMICFSAAVIVRLAFFSITHFTADDAFITFRYAENIAYGYGMVYNIGERVLGTTTPLFTLLLSFFALISVPLIKGALLINCLAAGMTAALLYKFACRLRFRHWAFVPAMLYILWPRSIVADASGMETSLFTFLTVAGFYFQYRRLPLYAIAAATLATVTRPEGLALLLLILVIELILYPHQWRALIMSPMIIIAPWVIFATIYFGSPVPHAIIAKLALYRHMELPGFWERLSYLLALHHPAGWLMTIAAVFGFVWLYRRQYWGRLAAVWLLGMILFYTVSPTHLFFWYAAPLAPMLLLLASAVLPWLSERIKETGWKVLAAQAVVAVVVLAATIVGNIGPTAYYREYQEMLDVVHKSIGQYLAVKVQDHGLVAAEDIGYIGFYSKVRILDRDGLVSPRAVPYNDDGNYLQLVLDASPEWVVAADDSPISQFVNDSVFLEQYRLYPDSAAGVYNHHPTSRFAVGPYYVFRKADRSDPRMSPDSLDNSASSP